MVKKNSDLKKDSSEVEQLKSKIMELEANLALFQERERRALADYQNLLRQNQNDRASFVKMANADLLLAILEPIEHLSTVSEQLKDQGLEMIVRQLWQNLKNLGLEEIETLGKAFDLDTMQVVEKLSESEEVSKVIRRGYRLNGQVIQHAQVVLG